MVFPRDGSFIVNYSLVHGIHRVSADIKYNTDSQRRQHIYMAIMKTKSHYENLPMQYTEIFLASKIEIFQPKNFDIFLIFAQNIDCGYTLEPPRHNLCFGAKIKKKIGIPLRTPVLLYKTVGFKGVNITRTCFHDEQNRTEQYKYMWIKN